MVADTGSGLVFAFGMLLLGIVVLIWTFVWLVLGFRLERSRNAGRVRVVASVVLFIAIAAMLAFPPMRRTGLWVEPETNTSIPESLMNSYDRASFGYIPTYAWVERWGTTEVPDSSGTLRLGSNPEYYLDGIRWEVEWVYLFGQLAIAVLFALPFLMARNKQ